MCNYEFSVKHYAGACHVEHSAIDHLALYATVHIVIMWCRSNA